MKFCEKLIIFDLKNLFLLYLKLIYLKEQKAKKKKILFTKIKIIF